MYERAFRVLTGFQCRFTELNGHLYFIANDSLHGMELWRLGDLPNSVERTSWPGKLTVYPNPANTTLHADIVLLQPQSIGLILTDAGGREVWRLKAKQFSEGTTTLSIPMSNLSPGPYFYRLADAQGSTRCAGSVVHQ